MKCCKKMSCYLKMEDPGIITHVSNFDEYGIKVHDGGDSFVTIQFCPWCGKKLPNSKRELWFEELGKIGFDDPLFQDIPEKYKTKEWYIDEKDQKYEDK